MAVVQDTLNILNSICYTEVLHTFIVYWFGGFSFAYLFLVLSFLAQGKSQILWFIPEQLITEESPNKVLLSE